MTRNPWKKCIEEETPSGNRLELFYNPKNGCLVVDLVDGKGRGGNELLRIYLTPEKEADLLSHCENAPEVEED